MAAGSGRVCQRKQVLPRSIAPCRFATAVMAGRNDSGMKSTELNYNRKLL
nr:hypothetical protein VDP59_015505 [Xanthomonas campestris pv. campestris]